MPLGIVDYTEPLSALEKQERQQERERTVVGPTWYLVTHAVSRAKLFVLVVNGRIASNSWHISLVGEDWTEYRSKQETHGYVVEELPNV